MESQYPWRQRSSGRSERSRMRKPHQKGQNWDYSTSCQRGGFLLPGFRINRERSWIALSSTRASWLSQGFQIDKWIIFLQSHVAVAVTPVLFWIFHRLSRPCSSKFTLHPGVYYLCLIVESVLFPANNLYPLHKHGFWSVLQTAVSVLHVTAPFSIWSYLIVFFARFAFFWFSNFGMWKPTVRSSHEVYYTDRYMLKNKEETARTSTLSKIDF